VSIRTFVDRRQDERRDGHAKNRGWRIREP
jgi:hypothetical protein